MSAHDHPTQRPSSLKFCQEDGKEYRPRISTTRQRGAAEKRKQLCHDPFSNVAEIVPRAALSCWKAEVQKDNVDRKLSVDQKMSGTGGRVPRTRHANLRLGITPYPVQPSRPPPVHYYPGDGTIDPSLLCPSASSKCDIFSPASDSQSTADLRNSVTSALLHTSDAVYANPPSAGYPISPLSESSSPRAYAGSVSDDHYDDLRMAPLAPHTPRTRFRFPAYEAPCNATPGSPSDTGATPGKFSSSGSSSGGDGKNTGLLSPLTLLPDATLYDMYAFIRTDDLCAETTARYSSETAQHFDPAPPAYESVSRTPGYTPRLEEYAHDVADEQIPLRELSMCACGLVIEVSSGDIVGRFTTASFAPACGHQAYMASTGTTATHPAQYAQLTPPVTLLRLPSAPASRGQGMNSSLGLYIPLDLDFTGNEGMDISPGSSLPDSPYSATFQTPTTPASWVGPPSYHLPIKQPAFM